MEKEKIDNQYKIHVKHVSIFLWSGLLVQATDRTGILVKDPKC